MLPPIGFLLAFRGYWVDKHNGERYVGWIFLMVIAVFSSIVMLIGLIALLNYSNSSSEEATSYLYIWNALTDSALFNHLIDNPVL